MDAQAEQKTKLSKSMLRFQLAMSRIYPELVLDYTVGEPGKFSSQDTQRYWLLYCTGKQDQTWYQAYGHVIAKITDNGIQLAREATVIRHTHGVKVAIDGLIRRHGGQYVSLSIAAFDVDRLRRAFGKANISEINQLKINVVDHDPEDRVPPKTGVRSKNLSS